MLGEEEMSCLSQKANSMKRVNVSSRVITEVEMEVKCERKRKGNASYSRRRPMTFSWSPSSRGALHT